MNSNEMKTKVLHHYRFKKRYLYIATEVGSFNSDILLDNGKEILEVEIKNSRQDILNESKKKKHMIYKNGNKYMPNKFYFGIPENLYQVCLDNLINSDYGIIIIYDKDFRMTRKGKTVRKEKYVKVIKKAKVLTKLYSDTLHHDIVMRCSSELIRLRMLFDKHLSNLKRRK